METNYKITIPKPCHEDWEKMTPDETGRFCNSCAKSVVDFSGMKAPEIQEYFIKNQGQKVCGRFKTEQLDSIIIQIPKNVLFSQVQFHKMFLLALLISMPGLLSSQNTDGAKQKIDKVEVVDSIREGQSIGKAKLKETVKQENDSVKKLKKAQREKQLKECKAQIKKETGSTQMGDTVPHLSGVVSIEPQTPNQFKGKEGDVYMTSIVEVQPSFPGGLVKFYEYVNSNLVLPEKIKKSSGKVFVTFVVDTDGSLSDIKILRSTNTAFNNELIKVLKTAKWIPGEQKGQKVKVLYSLPIKITAQ